MQIINQRTVVAPIDSVQPHPRNANRGDLGAIHSSLDAHGFYGTIVAQESSGRVLAGNHRWQAMKQAGATEIPVTFIDVDDETALRILLVDNKTTRDGISDSNVLAELLQELAATPSGLSGSGYDGDALDELLADLGQMQPELRGDPDAVPQVPEEPVSRRGDLWLLGKHRLLVGDATDGADVARLMAGARAECLWTDPPYGVSYVGKTTDALTLRNDNATILRGLLQAALCQAAGVLQKGAAFYIARPAGALCLVFGDVLRELGWHLHEELQWVKDAMVLGHSDYHIKHETVMFGYLPGDGRRGRGGAGWYGDNAQVSVFEVPRPKASPDHPTCKPLALIEPHLRNSSPPGGLILDVFAGSGSTMAACESTGRRCYMVEIEPAYCDVIVQRWENLTGKQAVREPATASAEASDHARVCAGA